MINVSGDQSVEGKKFNYNNCYYKKARYGELPYGFTLIELMVVIVILGLLATAVVVNVNGYISQGRVERARMDLANLKNALDLFYLEHHCYPTNEQGLAILAERSPTHPSGIISELPLDPWGHPYVYVCPGEHGDFDILSLGRDGAPGGTGEDADILGWQLNDSSQKIKQ